MIFSLSRTDAILDSAEPEEVRGAPDLDIHYYHYVVATVIYTQMYLSKVPLSCDHVHRGISNALITNK